MLILEDGHVALMRSQMHEYVRMEVLSAMRLEADGQLKLADSEAVDFREGDYLVELETGSIYIVTAAEWAKLEFEQGPGLKVVDPAGEADPASLEKLNEVKTDELSAEDLALLTAEEQGQPLAEQRRILQFKLNEQVEAQMTSKGGERFVAPDRIGA